MPVQSSEFSWRVLVQELIYRQIASSDLDRNLSPVDFHTDTARAELIDTFRLTHEHDLQFRLVRVLVDVLGKLCIYRVIFDWNVDCNPRLDVDKFLVMLLIHSLDCRFYSRSKLLLELLCLMSEFLFEVFDVNSVAFLFISQVFFPLFDLVSMLSQLLKKLQTGLIRAKTPLLKLHIKVSRSLDFPLKRIDSLTETLVVALELVDFHR